ncbi:MAG: phosphotransferase [Candidatus Coatesbacteria bacterium]
MKRDWLAPDDVVGEALARVGGGDAIELSGKMNRVLRFTDHAGSSRILKIRSEGMTENRLRFEQAFMRRLADSGIPAAVPILVGESTWYVVRGYFCEILPCVDGRTGRPEPADALLMGRLLGDLHRYGWEMDRSTYEPPQRHNQHEPEELAARVDDLLLRLGPVLSAKFLPRWEALRAAYPHSSADLPRAIRHGDLHCGNVIFSETEPSQVVGIIDTDMLAEGLRIFDVSYAIYFLRHFLVSSHGRTGEDLVRWRSVYDAFMHGYREQSPWPMSREEIRLVPLQIECIAIHFLAANARRQKDADGVARVFREDYQDVVDWLNRYHDELASTLPYPCHHFQVREIGGKP